jgi:hypothetical protein
MIDTDQKTPGRAPQKDKAALAKALRENLRRRKAREPAISREREISRERTGDGAQIAQQQAPENEAKWTR